MRTVAFRTILEDTLALAGYPYDTSSAQQIEIAARFINRHIRDFWEWGPWPEWTRAEQRAFASPYFASVNYTVGNVVYYADTGLYYQCILDSTGNLPTNGTYWTATDIPAARTIAFAQNGQRIIGRVWRVTKHDPYQTAREDQYSFPHQHTESGASVRDCHQATVYVLYSDPAPLFTSKVWSQQAAEAGLYSRYDIVFYPGDETTNVFPQKGLCYMADYDQSGAAVWIPVPFPRSAHNFVINRAAADLLRYYRHNEESATFLQAQGDAALLAEWDKINTLAYQNVIGAGI